MSACGVFCMGKCCTERKNDKYEYQLKKQDNKEDRIELRQDTKRIAYENGIDPNAQAWQAAGQIGTAFAGALGVNSIAKNLGGNMGNGDKLSELPLGQQLQSYFNQFTGGSSGTLQASAGSGGPMPVWMFPVLAVVALIALFK